MAVYVDKARNPYGRMIMSHMIGDNLEDLFAMARDIGMQASWFQPHSFPHFDVSRARRARALELGAIEIDRREIVSLMRSYRLHLEHDPIEKGLLDKLSRSPSFVFLQSR